MASFGMNTDSMASVNRVLVVSEPRRQPHLCVECGRGLCGDSTFQLPWRDVQNLGQLPTNKVLFESNTFVPMFCTNVRGNMKEKTRLRAVGVQLPL